MGGGFPSGDLYSSGFLTNALRSSSKSAAPTKPMMGETSKELNTSCALTQFTPSPKTRPLSIEFARPTPMMEPISVCELEAGNPRYHVPTFQIIAEINSENTMAKPAPEPTFSTSSTGSNATTPKATKPLDVRTPIKFHMPDHTTAYTGLSVWV
jgi:hypothetical protein